MSVARWRAVLREPQDGRGDGEMPYSLSTQPSSRQETEFQRLALQHAHQRTFAAGA